MKPLSTTHWRAWVIASLVACAVPGALAAGEADSAAAQASADAAAAAKATANAAEVAAAKKTDQGKAAAVTASGAQSPGPTDPGKGADYGAAGKVLFAAFALALFLESALAALFNWRPFLQYFVRGTRTVFSFAAGLALVCSSPELHLFDNLVTALYPKATEPLGLLGLVLSAMLLAGGSAGINNLLLALGFRSPRTPESIAPKPAPTMAWVAIRVTDPDNKPADPLLVMMDVNESGKWTVLGTIKGRSSKVRYFIADKGRFPTSGGHAVKGGETYAFKVTATDGTNRGTPAQWGPNPIAVGAIADIDFRV